MGKSGIQLFFMINLSTIISVISSPRELLTDVIIDKKN